MSSIILLATLLILCYSTYMGLHHILRENDSDYRGDVQRAIENSKSVLEAMSKSKNNIIFSFVDVKDFDIDLTDRFSNQVIVMFKIGDIEVLPKGITGSKIKSYLGVQFRRIKSWSVLPQTQRQTLLGLDFYGNRSK